MRSHGYYAGIFDSSFMSCAKDAELIVRKLLVDSKPYSDELKRLLVINTKDCLDENSPSYQNYQKIIDNKSIADLIDEGYIRFKPKIEMKDNQEVMSYIVITFDHFEPNKTNPHYRDCIIEIDLLCHIDNWDVGNFKQRPLEMAGYVDGLLNEKTLTGIGHLNLIRCYQTVLSEEIAGYCLMYRAVHGEDDLIEGE